jgi:hypothetical protein
MSILSAEVIEKLAGYIVNRRDKRLITLSVLILYACALLYHFIGGFFGAPEQKAALDSIEALAMVVVVAHIAGAAAQRAVAQRAIAKAPLDPGTGSQP